MAHGTIHLQKVSIIMKKLLSLAAAALSAITLCTSASAEKYIEYGIKYWRDYISFWKEGDDKALEELIDKHARDGDCPSEVLDTEYFTSENNYIIKVKLCMNHVGNENYDDYYMFFFALNDGTEYRNAGYLSENCFHERERNCYTTAEVLKMSGIPDPDMIFMTWIYYNNGDCDADLESVDFYPCTNGWNTLDGEKYYVRPDGTLATRSMTIGGIRYKFGKNGVCGGKYTGWTRSPKGRRYWKDGILQKNTEITTESGKMYTLDKNGYARVKR